MPAAWPPLRARLASRAGATVLIVSSLAFVARAEPSPAEIKTARQLFAEAETLRAQGDCQTAAEKLRLALQIKETPGLRFHLAHCEERLGQLVLADADYRRASELIRSGVQAPDVERLLTPAQKSLSERVPTLRVRVPVTEARVRVDGRDVPAEAASGIMPVDPGKHTVTVDVNGYDPFHLELSIAEGEDRVIDAKLRPHGGLEAAPATVASPALAVTSEPQRERSRFGMREVVVLGESALALAGAGIGVAFLLEHQGADKDVEAEAAALRERHACAGSSDPACDRLMDALSDRAHAGNVSIAGFVGAGVFGAAAVATWFLWPSNRKAGPTVGVAPFPGGAVVRGAF